MESAKKQIEKDNRDDKDLSHSLIIVAPVAKQHHKTQYLIPCNADGKAISLTPYLCLLSSKHIQLFHTTWLTFFICFYSWFSLTNLSAYIDSELNLTAKDKSIAIAVQSFSTIIFRIFFGDLCDKIGARYSYLILLTISLISFLCISWVSYDNVSFQIFSFFVGIIGASFVITQYHITQFFASKCVGIANGLSAGWGNFGGGVTMIITPSICTYLIKHLDMSPHKAWRYTTLLPTLLLLFAIPAYYLYTKDSPNTNASEPIRNVIGRLVVFDTVKLKTVALDYRVWILSLGYAVCFGIEVTVLNYFVDYFQFYFDTSSKSVGIIAFSFSLLNLFARGLGGYLSDMLYLAYGIQGRIYSLFLVLLAESVFLFLFAQSSFHFGYTLLMMVFFSFYVQLAEGIIYAIIPSFPKTEYHGLYMGIIGAGGNFGALIYSFAIFKNVPNSEYEYAWIICSVFVFISAFPVLCIKFTKKEITADTRNVASDFYFGKHDSNQDNSYTSTTRRTKTIELTPSTNPNRDRVDTNDIELDFTNNVIIQ